MMSDVEKRTGRQTAEAAEQTRKDILKAAAELFCQDGYSKVSLRAISEQAGVSHSLIRHHFGSKLNIWKRICDTMHQHFQGFIERLLVHIPEDVPSNQRLYLLKLNIHASLLLNPRPTQLMADAIRQEGELLDYVFADHDQIRLLLSQLLSECQQQGHAQGLTIEELKWVMISSAHSASSMRPLLQETYPNQSLEQCLIENHRLFARIVAGLLDVAPQHIPEVTSFEQLFSSVRSYYACQECPWS